MTHAYSENYLNDAMKNLGEAFDYAINLCKIKPNTFMELFIASGYAEDFETGNPKIISGLSGTELAMEVIDKSGISMTFPEPEISSTFSAEYWCGWIIAYYQFITADTFKNIYDNISMDEVLKLYSTHHEASEDKFVDTVNAIIKRKNNPSKLQLQRKRCNYSQKELSIKSGINLRTLQQYEIRAKNINKASAQSIVTLAKILGCNVEDLLEPNI